jgi:ABC-type transporter Mla subunit MlaD
MVGLMVALCLAQFSSLLVQVGRDEQDIKNQAITTLEAYQELPSGVNANLGAIAVSISHTSERANAVLEDIGRQCGTRDKRGNLQPCGVLADFDKLTATTRGTVGRIEIAADHEDRQLTTLDAQERQLFTDLDTTVRTSNQTVASVNSLVASPDVRKLLENANQFTAAAADTTKHADGIAAAAETVAKRYAYPPPKHWYQKVWDVSKTAGELTWDFMR